MFKRGLLMISRGTTFPSAVRGMTAATAARSGGSGMCVYVCARIHEHETYSGEQVEAAQPADDTVHLWKARSFPRRLEERENTAGDSSADVLKTSCKSMYGAIQQQIVIK